MKDKKGFETRIQYKVDVKDFVTWCDEWKPILCKVTLAATPDNKERTYYERERTL